MFFHLNHKQGTASVFHRNQNSFHRNRIFDRVLQRIYLCMNLRYILYTQSYHSHLRILQLAKCLYTLCNWCMYHSKTYLYMFRRRDIYFCRCWCLGHRSHNSRTVFRIHRSPSYTSDKPHILYPHNFQTSHIPYILGNRVCMMYCQTRIFGIFYTYLCMFPDRCIFCTVVPCSHPQVHHFYKLDICFRLDGIYSFRLGTWYNSLHSCNYRHKYRLRILFYS